MLQPQPSAPQQAPISRSDPRLAPRQPHQTALDPGQHQRRNEQNIINLHVNVSELPQQQVMVNSFQSPSAWPQQQSPMAFVQRAMAEHQDQHHNFNLQMPGHQQSQNNTMQQHLAPPGSMKQPSNAQLWAPSQSSAISQPSAETDQPPVELHEYTDNGPPADRRKMLPPAENGFQGNRPTAPQPLFHNRPGTSGHRNGSPNHQLYSSNPPRMHRPVPGTTDPVLGFINSHGLAEEEIKIIDMRCRIQENYASRPGSQGNRPSNPPVHTSTPVGPRDQGIRLTYPQFQVNTAARPSIQDPRTAQTELHRIQTMDADKEKRAMQIQEAAKLQLSQIGNAAKQQRVNQVVNGQEHNQATQVDVVCADAPQRRTRATSKSMPALQRPAKRAAPNSFHVSRPATRQRRAERPEILSRSPTPMNPTTKRFTGIQPQQTPARQQLIHINDDGTTRMVEAGPGDIERSSDTPRIEIWRDDGEGSFDTGRHVTMRENKPHGSDDGFSSESKTDYTGLPPPLSMPEDPENAVGRLFGPLQPVQPMRAGPGLYGDSPNGPPLLHASVDLTQNLELVNRVNSHAPYQPETWANIKFTWRDNPYYWIGFEDTVSIRPIVPLDVLPVAVQAEDIVFD